MNNKINIYKIGDTELELRVMPSLIYTRFQIEFAKTREPEVPMVELNYVGKKKGFEYNPKDPTYQELKSSYQMQEFQASVEFCIDYCVANDPPVDFTVPKGLGENNIETRRVVWVLTLLEQADKTADFIAACLGQSAPVEEEIAQERDRLKSNGQRGEYLELPVPENR